MSLKRLDGIVENLTSDKIKDRAEGISELRDLLGSVKARDAITSNGLWLRVLQAVFHVVVVERNIHVKKPTTAVQGRLVAAVQMVRWIVERAAADLPRKAIRALIAHLLQTVVLKRRLYDPVASDYIKSLRAILEYRPHLEHLDAKEWTDSVNFCWNVLFDQDIVLSRELILDDESRMELDELESTPAPTAASARSGNRAGQQEADLMACIERLFGSTSAPLVKHGADLLARFVRFFTLYPAETTAHLYAVGALNALMAEMEYNGTNALIRVAPTLWNALLILWPSKLTLLREAVGIAIRTLFPCITRGSNPEPLLRQLSNRLHDDLELRWRVEDLRLDALSLTPAETRGAFTATTFGIGMGFSTSQALSWATLELAADCLAAQYQLSERISSAQHTTPSRSKRRKVGQSGKVFAQLLKDKQVNGPITELVEKAEEVTSLASLHYLQVLVFLIDRHWKDLHDEPRRTITTCVHGLLSRLDTGHTPLQNWAFVAVGALAATHADGEDDLWPSLWSIALRRLSQSAVCRTACHAGGQILAARRVEHARLISDIQSLLEHDLLVTGPTFPFDSTCSFLARCLDLAAKDTHLFRLDLHHRVTSWLTAHLAGAPSKARLDIVQVFALCGRLTPAAAPIFECPPLMPSCRIAEVETQRHEFRELRDFMYDGTLPAYDRSSHPVGSSTASTNKAAEGTQTHMTGATGLLQLVSRTLSAALHEASEDETGHFWSHLSMDRARQLLDVAVLVLLLHGALDQNGSRPPVNSLQLACDVVRAVSVQLTGTQRAVRERWALVSAFDPLLIPFPASEQSHASVIVDPGTSSSVPLSQIPRLISSTQALTESRLAILRAIWTEDAVVAAFAEVRGMLQGFLNDDRAANDFDEDAGGDVAFAERVAPVTRSSVVVDSDLSVIEAMIPFATRALVSMDCLRATPAGPARVTKIVEVLEECDATRALPVAQVLFKAIKLGYAELTMQEADAVLQRLGDDFLPSYELARNVDFQLLGLDVLEATMPLWSQDDSRGGFPPKARKLCAWYAILYSKKRISAWRIRHRFASWLDAFLLVDPDQVAWEATELPSDLLPSMLGDEDLRVRFYASASTARLFPLAVRHERGESQYEAERALFRLIGQVQTNDLDDREGTLSFILTLANAFIANMTQRTDAYVHMLMISARELAYVEHIAQCFGAIAVRLGLGTRAALFRYMAPYVTAKHAKMDETQRDAAIPDRVSGYASRRDAAEAAFVPIGAVWLGVGDRDAFAAHCKLVGRHVSAGTTACYAVVAAQMIAAAFEAVADPIAASARAVQMLQPLTAGTDLPTKGNWKQTLAMAMDEVIAEMVALVWEPDPSAAGAYTWALRSSEGAQAGPAQRYAHLVGHTTIKALLRPLWPSYPADSTRRALQWLHSIQPIFSHPATIYRVCHSLVTRAGASVFVHEQMIVLYNLCFFLSLCDQLRDHRIMRLLLHSLGVLYERDELAPLTWGMLAYIFNEALSDTARRESVDGFATVMLNAAHVCIGRLESPIERVRISALHNLKHLETLAISMVPLDKTDCLYSASLQVAALWPRTLGEKVKLDAAKIIDVLDSEDLESGKFALVLPLSRVPCDNEELPSVLWRLLAALGPTGEVDVEQSLAFAQLLHATGGRVTPVWQPPSRTSEQRLTAFQSDIQDQIVARIAAMLRSSDLARVALAGQALARVSALAAEKAFAFVSEGKTACAAEIALFAEPVLLRPHEARELGKARKLAEVKSAGWAEKTRTSETWAIAFAHLLSDVLAESHPFYAQLAPVIEDHPTFASSILPMLVHSALTDDLLADGTGGVAKAIGVYFTMLLKSSTTDRTCVRTIVDIVSYLRGFKQSTINKPATHDQWLPDLPWTVLSRAAASCSMYTTALLFLELACEYTDLIIAVSPDADIEPTAEQDIARDLLYDIYENVDEPDGFYGIPSTDPAKALLRRYEHEGQALAVFGLQGALHESTSHRSGSTTLPIVEALSQFGLNRLAMTLLEPSRAQQTPQVSDQPSDLPFHLAWRSESWSLPLDETPGRGSSASIYAALRGAHRERDPARWADVVGGSFAAEVRKLRVVDLNSPVAHRSALDALLSLREVQHWQHELATLGTSAAAVEGTIVDLGDYVSFETAENVLLTRVSLLKAVQDSDSASEALVDRASACELSCLLQLSQRARDAGRIQSALNAISAAQRLETTEHGERATEYARVLWSKGEHALAIDALRRVLHRIQQQVETDARDQLECRLLSDLGEWSATARLYSAHEIVSSYFQPAEAIASRSPESYARVYLAFGTFCDSQYKALLLRKDEMRTLQDYQDRKATELERMPSARASSSRQSSSSGSNTTAEQARRDAQGIMELDRERLERFAIEISTALQTTARLYAQVLTSSDDHEDVVYRLIALWLEHHGDETFNAAFAKQLASIPSRKFVALAHQLSARMSKLSDSSGAFRTSLNQLVGRLTREHPFHTLYHIYSLRATAGASSSSTQPAASAVPPKTRKSLGMEPITSSQAGRHKLASDFFAHAKGDARLTVRIQQLEQVCDAYVETALLPKVDAAKKTTVELQPQLKLIKLKNLAIPVSTYDLPIDPTMQYLAKDLPCILKYDRSYTLVGGINAPKLVNCHTTIGGRMRQLLKGGDDTRQDAVMEQVFGVVNQLLNRDPATRRRDLHVRRYKVIPLVASTGLIEFMGDAKPIGELISPLHALYNPDDLPINKVRTMIKDQRKQSVEAKVEVFEAILGQFHPAMRHLFRDKRKLATPWFEMRLHFQRSVAAVSMVGWVLGIGDRHVSNLMLDEKTGEMVPIDFGIAFDAAELLPVPEKVPFRLTQDIVDGLGLTGVDGVFRRCSEETLRVLREQAATIMSILEVLKYDPLQKWTLTAGKANKAQDQAPPRSQFDPAPSAIEDEDVPADAARALAGVTAKLSTTLSVQQRVTELIRQATAIEHLATIFPGWQPYL